MLVLSRCLLLVAGACLVTLPAKADPVGTATAVERDVTHGLAGANAKLLEGGALARDELVTTQTASSTRLQFLDETQLFVGPASRVKLDRFVFNPDKTAQTMSLELLRGGFRFVTGKSEHKSYTINTPEATIGVRGTVIGVFVSKGKTLVKLKDGGATVCLRRKGKPQCSEMEDLETTVEVTARAISPAGLRRSRGPDFGIWCSAGKANCGLK